MTFEARSEQSGHESYISQLIDAAPVAMLVATNDGMIKIANRAASDTFGYPVDQLVMMNVDALVPERYRAGHYHLVKGFFDALVPRVMGVGREVLALHADGHEFPVEIGLSPAKTPEGAIVVTAIVDITERKQRDKESTLARLVQEAMLPVIPTDLPGIRLAARSDPADATGGDFYDLHRMPNGHIEIVIGDASGHGFAAALVTATARSYLRALSGIESDLGKVLARANLLLIDDVLDSRFVTLLLAVYSPHDMTLSYTGAGHLGYLIAPNGELQCLLDKVGTPLGWFTDAEYPVTRLKLEHGNLLVLLTDGIEEAMNSAGDQFGRQRVLDLLRRERTRPADEIVAKLHEAVYEFCGPLKRMDDATVIVGHIL